MTRSSTICLLGFILATVWIIPSTTRAQWGNNAPRCPEGRCAPPRQSWGYHQTKWSRWPGAVYPDMIRPATGRPGAEIPPSQIDLPTPAEEAEIRPTSPLPARTAVPQPSAATPHETESPVPSSPLQPDNGSAPPNRLPGLAPLDDLPGAEPPDSSQLWQRGGTKGGAREPQPHDLPAMRMVESELAGELPRIPQGVRLELNHVQHERPDGGPHFEIPVEKGGIGSAVMGNSEPCLLTPAESSKPLELPTRGESSSMPASSAWRTNNPLRGNQLRTVADDSEIHPGSVLKSTFTDSSSTSLGRANPLR